MTKTNATSNEIICAPSITDATAQEIRMTYLHYRKLGAGGGDTFFDGKAQGIAETLAFLGIEIPWINTEVNAEVYPEVDES